TLIEDILATTTLQIDQAPAPFIRGGDQSQTTKPEPPVDVVPTATPAPDPSPPLGGEDSAPNAIYAVYLPLIAHDAPTAQSAVPTIRQGNTTLSMAATLNTSFDYNQVITGAKFYGPRQTNSDGCYIWANENNLNDIVCQQYAPGYPYIVGVDGAHFISCVLADARYPGATCNKIAGSLINMNNIRSFLLGSGARIINTNTEQPVAGDVVVLNYANAYCWGGVVTSIVGRVPYVMAHSQEHRLPGYAADSMRCDDGAGNRVIDGIEYLRLDSEAPYAWFIAPPVGIYTPGDMSLSYDGSDEGSGVASFTLRYAKEGATSVLVGATTERVSTVHLNLPCRAVTAEVLARDYANNLDESRKGSLNLFLLLHGDVDGDGRLTRADLEAIRDAEGLRAGQADFSTALDPTGDGWVDAADRLFVQNRMGSICPQP
ncbi:MAG: hypothetical protein HGA65_14260, partial [Oscillochloris sp.]|nr:hypothetical protein [Oscillochloris sp.]